VLGQRSAGQLKDPVLLLPNILVVIEHDQHVHVRFNRGIAAGMRSVQHDGYKVCSVSLTDLGREQVHGVVPTSLCGPGQLVGRRSHGSRNIGRITRQPIRPPAVGAFGVNSSHPPVRAGDLCAGRRIVERLRRAESSVEDVERAKDESPFGTTVAHGNLTLSMIDGMRRELIESTGFKLGVNYGWNKIRFPAPVPSGSKVRATAEIMSVDDVGGGWVQVVTKFTVEAEDSDKPVCVAESVGRALPE